MTFAEQRAAIVEERNAPEFYAEPVEAEAPAAIGHNKPPKKARRRFKRTCCECGVEFLANDVQGRFCDKKHKDAWKNRSLKRGAIMVPLVLAWRAGRGSKEEAKWAYKELCKLADQWNAEDRAAGRTPMAKYLLPKMRSGWSAADVPAEG